MVNNIIRFFSFLDKKTGGKHFIQAIPRGYIYTIPILLIGSICLIIISFPVTFYQVMMNNIFGENWKFIFTCIHDGTFGILSLIVVICISYSIATYNKKSNIDDNSIIVVCVSLSCFMAISGISEAGFSISSFGSFGIFTAMLTAITSSMLFIKLKSYNLCNVNVYTDGANYYFNNSIKAIYPAAITIVLFAFLNYILQYIFNITDLQIFITDKLCNLFLSISSPVLNGLLFIISLHVFWFFGIHGGNIVDAVAIEVFLPYAQTNLALINSGSNPTMIFSKTFFDTFVLFGGCGTVLCLIVAILIVGKHKNIRNLGKLSFLPALFNINELIVFGIPLVLNPIFLIPFLFVPIILTLISYGFMYFGIVPYCFNTIEWTTPIFISGYLSTMSVKGSILQLLNFIIGTLIYIPFVKLNEKVSDNNLKDTIQQIVSIFKANEKKLVYSNFLNNPCYIGNVSRFLIANIEQDIKNKNIILHYQPQVNYSGKVIGLEALLRWKYEDNNYIYPPVIISLIREANLIDDLYDCIFEKVCEDLNQIYNLGYEDISISVNISAFQLENPLFCENLETIIKKHNIHTDNLKIEITEQTAISSGLKTLEQIIKIKKLGIKFIMDDFGIGHSSILYLKDYEFDIIKIDGSLIKEITKNKNCQNIVSSIVSLSKSMNFSIIAEYVETQEQVQILHKIGCNQYQGYLYSRAIPIQDVINYIESNNNHYGKKDTDIENSYFHLLF